MRIYYAALFAFLYGANDESVLIYDLHNSTQQSITSKTDAFVGHAVESVMQWPQKKLNSVKFTAR